MLPNPPAFEYTGESTESRALPLLQLPNVAVHKEGRTQTDTKMTKARTSTDTSRGDQFKQKEIKGNTDNLITEEAVDLDSIFLINQNTFTEY